MLEFVNFNSAATERRKTAVVFVHGFTGDVRATWRRIPEFLQAMQRLRDWDLLGFGYQSRKLFDLVGLWSADAQLEEIATMLNSRPEIGDDRYPTLTFVAHSMGGLVVQRALVKYKELRARTAHGSRRSSTPSSPSSRARARSSLAGARPARSRRRSDVGRLVHPLDAARS